MGTVEPSVVASSVTAVVAVEVAVVFYEGRDAASVVIVVEAGLRMIEGGILGPTIIAAGAVVRSGSRFAKGAARSHVGEGSIRGRCLAAHGDGRLGPYNKIFNCFLFF